MKAVLRLSFLFASMVCLSASPIPATTIIPVSDRQLYSRADLVVHGIVLSNETQPDEYGRVETVTVVRPLEVVKGSLGGDLVLHQLGGRLKDGQFFQIWGRPEYTPGGEVVVFAIARSEGDYQTAELLLGKFAVQFDERSFLFAVPERASGKQPGVTWQRPAPRNLGIDGDTDRGEDNAEGFEADRPRELAGFLAYLRAGAVGVCESAAIAEGVLTPVVHREDVPPQMTPEWANISGLWRYTNGATAVWTLTGIANITGGGTAEALGAMNAWNNDPNSTINQTLGSGTSNVMQLNAMSSPCGWSTCLSGSGVIGCGGPNGGGSNTWRGDSYGTITGGTVWLRSYCSLNGFSSVTTQAVLTHELGHTLGLGHSDQAASPHDVCRGDEGSAQMRSVVQGFTALGTDDQDAIRWLYGDGGNSCALGTLAVTALTASPAPPQPTGTQITWTVSTSGGTAPLQYRFLRYSYTTASWTVVQNYSTSNTFTWTPSASEAGAYALEVWVKNAGSAAAWDAYRTSPAFTITPASSALAVTSLNASPTLPQPAGTPITWTVTTTGGTAPLQYKFLRYSYSSASWTVVQNYSTSNTFSWTPSANAAGNYALEVWVKNAGSAASWDAYRTGAPFTITSSSALAVSSLNASPSLPQPVGATIRWTAVTSGGTPPLQYRFLRYSYTTATWTVVQNYSTSNTFSWTPSASEAGNYALEVWVKNAGSAAAWDAYKTSAPFTITP